MMERVTFRIDEDDIEDVDDLIDAGEFPSRSEVIRTAIDEFVETGPQRALTDGGADVRSVQLGQVETTLEAGDTVADLFEKTSVSGGFNPTPETTVIVRDDDWTEKRVPEPENYVPFDLSTVEDGDALHTYRLRASERPAYETGRGRDE